MISKSSLLLGFICLTLLYARVCAFSLSKKSHLSMKLGNDIGIVIVNHGSNRKESNEMLIEVKIYCT